MSAAPQRNRSLDYRDHAGLMHRWALKFHARLQGAGLGVEFDDVKGELALAFVKASRTYKPESGFSFTAYLSRSCQNNFNKVAEKLMLEQFGCTRSDEIEKYSGKTGLGCISVQAIEASGMLATGSSDGGPADSFYETLPDDTFATPDEVQDAKMTLRDLVADQTLLPETRAYLAKLINPKVQLSPRVVKRIEKQAPQIRKQIRERWNIRIQNLCL
jgi:hypothetical protein